MMSRHVRGALTAALLFYIISSPYTYNLVNSILGTVVTVAVNGTPTTTGLVIHSAVYGLIVYYLMTN